MEAFLKKPSKMHRVFTLLTAFFIAACIYEGIKLFNEDNYNHYSFRLSHTLLTPLFSVVTYVTIVVLSRLIIPYNFNSDIFFLGILILVMIANFFVLSITCAFPKYKLIMLAFPVTSLLWVFSPCFAFDSVGFSESMSPREYSLRDHFTSELGGLVMIIILPPLTGILAYRGLFLADTLMDKVVGWIVAQCSVLFLSMIFFSSVLVEMCKVEKDTIYLTWTRKKIISTFLLSIIRNSVFQSFVYPGFLLTCMAFLDSSCRNLCFKLYYICFIFVFRVFPSFNWAPCLSGAPRKHTRGSLSDWNILDLAISNNYTWLLALTSTLIGCIACSFIFQVKFGSVLFSLESFMLTPSVAFLEQGYMLKHL